MTTNDERGELHWTELQDPDDATLEQTREQLGLHPLAALDDEHLLLEPAVEDYDTHVAVTVWDVPSSLQDAGSARIALVAGDGWLLTVQHDGAPRDLEPIVRESRTPLAAIHSVLDAVTVDLTRAIADLDDDLEQVERQVFEQRGGDDDERIYRLRRRIGQLDRLATGIASALDAGMPMLESRADDELRPYLARLRHRISGAAAHVADQHRALDAVVTSHQGRAAARQNADMRTISAVAALLAVPTLLSSFYGMNFSNLPLIDWGAGWIIVLAASIVLDVVAVLLFRRWGWVQTARERDAGDDE